jgi:hypothetical protein
MKKTLSYILCILLMSNCVDPFTTSVSRELTAFVIDGRITDLDPPYKISLMRATNYNNRIDGYTRYVSEAAIQVCDDLGNCIPFYEMEKGKYETTTIAPKGVPGRFYHVEITTKEGKRLFSKPEKLIASPPIKSVYYEYDINTVRMEGFDVYLDTEDPVEEKNFYKWETVGYFPYSSQCFHIIPSDEYPLIASDKNTNGNTISRFKIRNVTFNRRDYYVVEVYQYALSQSAYEFIDNIKTQITSTGSIFDPPPAFIEGNMYNPEDASDIVLGYFVVAGVYRKGVAINRAIDELTPFPVSKPLEPTPCYCGIPCPGICPGGPNNPCKCGDPPCPPECHNKPGVTSVAPPSWPLPHNPC